MKISKDDGYPLLCDVDDAILVLAAMIDGEDGHRGRDTLLSCVIRLLKHYKAQETIKAREALP